MFQSAFRYVLLLLFCFSVSGLAAQSKSSSGKAWLKEYNEHHEYDGVYVVKKVAIPCRTYETYLVDGSGKKLTPALRDIGDFSAGLAEFVPMDLDSLGMGKHGFINRQGKVVIPAEYVGTDKFVKGKTWVIYRVGKQYGLSYIDSLGKTIYKVPIQYFKDDFKIADAEVSYVCSHDAREDIIWRHNKEVFILNWNFSPYIEKEIQSSKYIYHFYYKGKFGIIDKDMVLKIPVSLEDIDPDYHYSGQGMERVQYGDKYGYIDVFNGELITPFEYEDTRKPTNGLFWVKKNGKWGCIDKTGKTRIAFLYDEATGFTKEDRSAVAINGKFGHIDKKGRIRTPLKYDFASYYNNGISMVRIDDKYGYIDTTGHFIIKTIYDEALPFDQKTTTVERSWIRFTLAMDGTEEFVGFSYKLNAVFILIGLVIFIRLNGLLFERLKKARAARVAKK
jgi:hypothetical protein